MKVISRKDFGEEFFLLYETLGTNPDKNADRIERILKRYGFSIGTDHRGSILIDEDGNDE